MSVLAESVLNGSLYNEYYVETKKYIIIVNNTIKNKQIYKYNFYILSYTI